MIDPSLSLAVSVYHNKGVYALLLGSGVSRSSGIPTGWEIVQDLIKKVAHLKEETCEPNPDAWFTKTFGVEPNYSDVLDQIAKSPAERSQLLRGYFEPSEEELAEGRKQPSLAHKAIARLIARGFIRVIVTTNFDRLLEQALAEVGIQPVVISSADAVQGALPLAHSRCSIIKINGDYLDTRLKNTRGELEHYDAALDKLLDQVFDEYGIIVSGWSAEWDIALCNAVQRCPSRRFTTYWAQRGMPSQKASDLIAFRSAMVLQITNADAFFQDLEERVSALESFSASDPLSAQLAVARVKKYLSSSTYRINYSDLFSAETERAHRAITDARFSVQGPGNALTGETVLQRVRLYEAELGVLLPMLVCGAHWSTHEHQPVLLRSFKRIADQSGPEAGLVIWLKLRRYPALFLLYGMGLGAVANSNYRFLKTLFDHKIRVDSYKPEEFAAGTLHNLGVLTRDEQRILPGREREYTPLSNHLFDALREPLREYLPDDAAYDAAFDWLEYLICLAHIDQQITRPQLEEEKSKNPDFHLWAPVGRFCWKGERNVLRETEARGDGSFPPDVTSALQAGFCEAGDGTRTDKYLNLRAALVRFIGLVRNQWGVF